MKRINNNRKKRPRKLNPRNPRESKNRNKTPISFTFKKVIKLKKLEKLKNFKKLKKVSKNKLPK